MTRSILEEVNIINVINVKSVIEYCSNYKVKLNAPNYVFDRKKQATNNLQSLGLVRSGLDAFEQLVRSILMFGEDEDDEEDSGQVDDENGDEVI